MTRSLRTILAGIVLACLAACAGPGGRLLPAAAGIQVFDLQIDTSMDWARIRQPREEVWTIDGLPLNRFVLYSNVKPGEHVFLTARERKRRPDGPWFRPGMRPDELRDVLVDALREDGWSNIRTDNLRPARFGDAQGLRFEATLTADTGLVYRAMFAAVERNGRLTHCQWLAPAEYYYDRDAAAVDRMIASIRFNR